MSRTQHDFAAMRSGAACTEPAVGKRLSAYLAGLLEGPAAGEVEAHIRDCEACGEFYIAIIGMRAEARLAGAARAGAARGGKVLRLADFRKERR